MGFWNSIKKSKEENSEDKTSVADTVTIDFGEVLDISFAAKFHAQLKDEIKKNSAVNFITSELTRIDASCLQVLASFMCYAKENDINIEWVEPCDVIKEASRLTGLTEILELNH